MRRNHRGGVKGSYFIWPQVLVPARKKKAASRMVKERVPDQVKSSLMMGREGQVHEKLAGRTVAWQRDLNEERHPLAHSKLSQRGGKKRNRPKTLLQKGRKRS